MSQLDTRDPRSQFARPPHPQSQEFPGDRHHGEGTPSSRPHQPVGLGAASAHLAGPESSYASGPTLTAARAADAAGVAR